MLYLRKNPCLGQDHLVGARSCRWSCRWVLSVVLSASSVGVLSARLVGVLSACLVGDLSGHISTSSKLANQPRFQPAAQPASQQALWGPCCRLVGPLSKKCQIKFGSCRCLVGALFWSCRRLVGAFWLDRRFFVGSKLFIFLEHLVGPCQYLVLHVLSCRRPCRGQGFP